MQIKQENNVKSRRFQAKTSAWWLEKRSAITANNFDFMIPDNELTKTHSQSSFIYSQSNLWYSSKKYYIDAAVSLLTNIIPKGIIKQIWCLCLGSKRGSQRYHCENITKFACWIRTLAAWIIIEYLHKAVFGKIPVKGTDLGSSQWS